MKKTNKKQSNQWADHLTRQAKADNYPARSVYKLMEIQNKFKVIQKGSRVLDLGCAPGSWLLYAATEAGSNAHVIGIDLQPVAIQLPGQACAIVGDILKIDLAVEFAKVSPFHTVLSDMAPATTGRKDVDALKSFELCNMALMVTTDFLAPGGHFVCKIFQGNEFEPFIKQVKLQFRQCKIFKPDSCRKSSKEIYIIGKDKK